MCTPIFFGGIRFKDFSVFNDAVLDRQTWWLVQRLGSLLGRVMKAKYYRNCNFLDGALEHAGSYFWRSLWSSKALVKERMIWCIDNGCKVNIWMDLWVTDKERRFITSNVVDSVQQVSDLMDLKTIECDVDLILKNVFFPSS